MRLLTWLIGTSCLLLMALFVALFAIAHQAWSPPTSARISAAIPPWW